MRTEREKGYFYVLTNKMKNVLYVGSTKDIVKRIKEHGSGYRKGFTQRYNVRLLVYCEKFEHVDMARDRERVVKGWRRQRKIELIESKNKEWKDISGELTEDPSPSLRSGSG